MEMTMRLQMGAGEMARWLKAQVSLLEDLCSIPSSHMATQHVL